MSEEELIEQLIAANWTSTLASITVTVAMVIIAISWEYNSSLKPTHS